MRSCSLAISLAFAAIGVAAPACSLAWGAAAYRLIGRLAVESLAGGPAGVCSTAGCGDFHRRTGARA